MELGAEAEASFTAWVASRRDDLLRTAVLISSDRASAEDLLQDALVKVARRWGRLRDGNPEGYARQVMYHANISWWRSRRREQVVPEVFEPSGRVGADAGSDRALVLRQALSRLTAKQRAVIVLRYVEDRTEREAAQVLGVSVGTVKSQTAAALARLRAEAPELGELIGREGGPR